MEDVVGLWNRSGLSEALSYLERNEATATEARELCRHLFRKGSDLAGSRFFHSVKHLNGSILGPLRTLDDCTGPEEMWYQMETRNAKLLESSMKVLDLLDRRFPEDSGAEESSQASLDQKEDEEESEEEGEEEEEEEEVNSFDDVYDEDLDAESQGLENEDFDAAEGMSKFEDVEIKEIDPDDPFENVEALEHHQEKFDEDDMYLLSKDFDDEDDQDYENATYADFFGGKDSESKSKPKQTLVKRSKPEEQLSKGKQILFDDEDSQEDFEEQEHTPEDLSRFEAQQLAIQRRIMELEERNISQKDWDMIGEVSASQRP